MTNESSVTLVGGATRDPELRFTPGGMAVTQFGLAVNRRRQDRNTQEWKDEVSFFDVVAYGTLAENVAESINKGARVLVSGRLQQRSWETQQGEKRSKIEVVADEVGPSLRWATAEVTKNEPRQGQGGGGGQAAANSAPAGGPTYDYDMEEPFVLDAFDGEDRFGHGQRRYL